MFAHHRINPVASHLSSITYRSYNYKPTNMKFAITFFLIALIAVFGACAAPVQKPVMISFPQDAPQSVVDEAMEAIKAAVRILEEMLPNKSCARTDINRAASSPTNSSSSRVSQPMRPQRHCPLSRL